MIMVKDKNKKLDKTDQAYHKLSKFKQICYQKLLPSKETKSYDKKAKQISKNDALLMLEMDIDYDADKNRFFKDDQQISLESIKKCARSSQFFDDISANDMADFFIFCTQTPTHALDHPVGKKIFENCKQLKHEYLVKIEPMLFYRARILNEDELPYVEDEMRKAPFGISPQGRFNNTGRGVFYLTDSSKAAKLEVLKHSNNLDKIQIAQFKNKETLFMIDIRDWNNDFAKYCLSPIKQQKTINKPYIIPNFFSDCLKRCNIDGIIYTNKEKQNLYAFFDDHHFICVKPAYQII
ncbi:MAG: RES family NAD+ phosphorylase [Thomasclavelia sp.]